MRVACRLAAVAMVVGSLVRSVEADAPPRIARPHAWSGGLNVWPYPLVSVGIAWNPTARLAVAARVGTVLLIHGAELDGKLYLGTGELAPYLFGGVAALWVMIHDPDDGAAESRLRGGLFGGLGVEVLNRSGYYSALQVAGFTAPLCLKAERACIGGGLAVGRRW